jgi:hypothetical protein
MVAESAKTRAVVLASFSISKYARYLFDLHQLALAIASNWLYDGSECHTFTWQVLCAVPSFSFQHAPVAWETIPITQRK